MAGVVLEGVSRVFAGGLAAVDNIDLEVYDKEFLVLVGPSGCGKSTTLRMIAGLEDVSAGEIRIGGRRVNDVPPKDRDIAMVFQNYALYPHMTVAKNMAFGLELRYGTGWLRRAAVRWIRPQRAAELAERRGRIVADVRRAAGVLGIEHLLDRMPRQLSGGERQRVALGRAIVREPAAFLFDEPLSNLDARLRVEMRRELKELHQRLASTMIYVTHDQVEALTLGQRIVVLDRGSIQQLGTPMEVYDRPKNRFVAGFIGTPPMNFLEGVAKESDGAWVAGSGRDAVQLGRRLVDRLQSAGAQGCVLGIRPEDLRVVRADEELATDESLVLRGIVHLVEPLGDATLATVCVGRGGAGDTGSHAKSTSCVVTKMESRVGWQVGDPVQAMAPAHRVHIFDATSGENLSPASFEA
jgi:multiple sugar transport system ATP-binding protein